MRARRALDGWLATGDGGAAAAAATTPPLTPATPPSAADLVTRQTSMVLCHNLEAQRADAVEPLSPSLTLRP